MLGVLAVCSLAGVPATVVAESDPIDYNTARRDRKLAATRTSGPIELDGQLDEPAVGQPRRSPRASFRTIPARASRPRSTPKCGCSTTTTRSTSACSPKTDEPGEIIVNELRKDFNTANADGFQIVIDTFHDERNGYQFAINPGGREVGRADVERGARQQRELGRHLGRRARASAKTAGMRRSRFRSSTLKFTAEALQTWGINFQRRLRRMQREQLLVAAAAHSPAVARLDGRHDRRPAGPQAGRERARQAVRAREPRTRSASARLDSDYDAGFDVKYGVTSGLTWDFTVNTDFSQVEADEQQVNLTRFSLFFPEKRDFFLENSGVFQFGAGQHRRRRRRRRRPPERVAGHDLVLQPPDRPVADRRRDSAPGRHAPDRPRRRWSVGALNIQQREQDRQSRRPTSRRCGCAATSSPTPTSA